MTHDELNTIQTQRPGMTGEAKMAISAALYLVERAIQTVEMPWTRNSTIQADDYESLVRARKALGEAHFALLEINNESSR